MSRVAVICVVVAVCFIANSCNAARSHSKTHAKAVGSGPGDKDRQEKHREDSSLMASFFPGADTSSGGSARASGKVGGTGTVSGRVKTRTSVSSGGKGSFPEDIMEGFF